MRRLLLIAVLALVVVMPGKSLEDTRRIRLDDSGFITQVSNSIVIIVTRHEDGSTRKGSGIVVSDRIIMTARHVLSDGLIAPPLVLVNGTTYLGLKTKTLDNTDVGFIELATPISNAHPIEWNEDTSEGDIHAFAFGAWGMLTEVTYSAGTIHRKAEHMKFGGQELDWVIGGSVMLFFGFSGGALVDQDGRLIGVSFGANEDGTRFVDSRPLRAIALSPDLFK